MATINRPPPQSPAIARIAEKRHGSLEICFFGYIGIFVCLFVGGFMFSLLRLRVLREVFGGGGGWVCFRDGSVRLSGGVRRHSFVLDWGDGGCREGLRVKRRGWERYCQRAWW